MVPTPTQIMNLVKKLDSHGQVAVAVIAGAVLQTQKNSEKILQLANHSAPTRATAPPTPAEPKE